MGDKSVSEGTRGGNATARGERSKAIGGDAGPTGNAPGGRGGDVDISQSGMTAVGGQGGGGGVGPGMPGMDVDDSWGNPDYAEGGMGGEANQPDGRGGRGGQAPGYEEICRALGKTPRPHMKRPYWPDDEDVHVGRGGDAPDTPQYKARRLIVELLKADQVGTNRGLGHEVALLVGEAHRQFAWG